jgi:NitT/TauT family transport system ATP-binding protein
VLDGVDLEVREGELVAIVGPSGCGKSTFLGAVDGLVKMRAGEIRVDDVRVDKPGADRAMVFQQDSLFPWRTVMRNISYGLELQGRLPKAEIRDRAASLVELVGLKGFGEHYPHELSGGMRQRVNIARALATDPQLLLLDEPSSGLNEEETEEMAALLKTFVEEGLAVLLVEHDMSFVMGTCEYIHVLDFGVIIAEGTPAEVQADSHVQAAYLGTKTEEQAS